ncbi:NADP-dependent oxidoreductase [Streptomyces sp. NPDC052052]|uniref:NADP-dependent oxidoreductase n=1 Tax=Streptomyces sp. NPDC052052 TaxID=3154756 RepID=UPI00344ADFD8
MIIAPRFGGPEVLEAVQAPEPSVPDGGVLVEVRTIGLNPVDGMMRRGEFGGQPPLRLGTEFAGVVLRVGSRVSDFAPGDEVIGFGTLGSYAEQVVADPANLARKPAGVSWEEAGGLSGAGQTALTILDALELRTGETLLANGASGGVGTMLVQLARRRGIQVIGTAGERNQEYLAALGATPVVYGAGLADRIAALAPGGIDAAIEMSGSAEAARVSLEVAPRNRVASIVPRTAQPFGIPLLQVRRSARRLDELAAAVADKSLTVTVQQVFDLKDAAAAHRVLDQGHTRGKLLLRASA